MNETTRRALEAHWTSHLDDDGNWIVREPSCAYCAAMLGSVR